MAPATTAPAAPPRTMQGIAIPAASVQPAQFFAGTRRQKHVEKTIAYAGQPSDQIELLKADILSKLQIRFVGQVVTQKKTGAINSNGRWPLDLLRKVLVSANGQANLINVSGAQLKARQVIVDPKCNDRGISQTVGAATVNQGTLAQGGDSWGIGTQVANVADGTYNVDLTWDVPIAQDQKSLLGALFLQTSTSDITLQLQYATLAELFTLTNDATVAITGTFTVTSTKYSIPIGQDGQIIVPDLSAFHSLIGSRFAPLTTGENEIPLAGQGAGKNLLRVFWQVFNGAPNNPVPVTDANFGNIGWRYGTNETPEIAPASSWARDAENMYSSAIGAVHGFACIDYADIFAARDVVDLGTMSQFRVLLNVQPALVLTNPSCEYVQELVFLSGQA
jgi:hypothetical protein